MDSFGEAPGQAAGLMLGFAERTGLNAPRAARRYLWTDAYAVCNYLALGRLTGAAVYPELAGRLIDQVHHVLGRFREDDVRGGCFSGFAEGDAAGQSFHYLTRWMQALDQMARATAQLHFNQWARELAEAAHSAFVCGEPGQESVGRSRRLIWKMSTDLSRPLVPSKGQHDALDGWITYLELQATAAELKSASGPNLEDAIRDFATMLQGKSWATADPLGLGGLLGDTFRVAQLIEQGALPHAKLLQLLLEAALQGLRAFGRQNDLGGPASQRLAFRELGLAIGLCAIERLGEQWQRAPAPRSDSPDLRAQLRVVAPYIALRDEITAFWVAPAHRECPAWREHQDINDVMLATCLLSTS